ncbi:MAG: hypothetical protein WC307_06050 [Candidatus Nanoarchaeia archaeon]|jgi:hypothetical protein
MKKSIRQLVEGVVIAINSLGYTFIEGDTSFDGEEQLYIKKGRKNFCIEIREVE